MKIEPEMVSQIPAGVANVQKALAEAAEKQQSFFLVTGFDGGINITGIVSPAFMAEAVEDMMVHLTKVVVAAHNGENPTAAFETGDEAPVSFPEAA